MKYPRLVPILLLCGVALGGCATGSDVERLQSQIAYLNQKVDRNRDEAAANSERLADLRVDQQKIQPRLQRTQMDVSMRLEQIERELTDLTAAQERVQRDLQSAARERDELASGIEARKRELQVWQEQSYRPDVQQLNARMDSLEAGLQKMSAEVQQRLSAATSGKKVERNSGESAYDYARRLYLEDAYAQLIRQYPDLLEDGSDSENPGISYWYGSAQLKLGMYDQAALTFDTLIRNYPQHWTAGFAVLKQGHAFREMGDRENARLFYQKVLSDYENSNAVKHARQALEDLR